MPTPIHSVCDIINVVSSILNEVIIYCRQYYYNDEILIRNIGHNNITIKLRTLSISLLFIFRQRYSLINPASYHPKRRLHSGYNRPQNGVILSLIAPGMTVRSRDIILIIECYRYSVRADWQYYQIDYNRINILIIVDKIQSTS